MTADYMNPIQYDMPFSDYHGNNTHKMNDYTLTWNQKRHDGICVSNRPIKKGDRYELVVKGDGHVIVGISDRPPSLNDLQSGAVSLVSMCCTLLYQIHLKKNVANLLVECLEKRKICIYDREDVGSRPHVSYTKKTKSYYLYCEILFGDVDVTFRSVVPTKVKQMHWNVSCGLNVEQLQGGATTKLRFSNPLALCGCRVPITKDKAIILRVAPIPNSHWSYISVGVSNKTPRQLHLDSIQHYYTGKVFKHIGPLVKFKRDVAGIVSIKWNGGDRITCTNDGRITNIEVISPTTDSNQPIYLILELFRIIVSIATMHKGEDDGYEVIDSPPPRHQAPSIPTTLGSVENPPAYVTVLADHDSTGVVNHSSYLTAVPYYVGATSTAMDTDQSRLSSSGSGSETYIRVNPTGSQSSIDSMELFGDGRRTYDNTDRPGEVTELKTVENPNRGRDDQFSTDRGSLETPAFNKPDTQEGAVASPTKCGSFGTPTLNNSDTQEGSVTSLSGEQWLDALRTNYTFLVENMDAMSLADRLFEQGIIDVNDHEAVEMERSKTEKSRCLIRVLRRQCDNVRQILATLTDTSQGHIVDMLSKTESR
ncbi:hypothetical protein SNE40_022119 [Patella caerulea]|uniref:CARD domain-containing protein n=1 Tax=Patella caerulea TaxID=87958 RepID=A0AAN8IXJ5_PATCE